LWSSATGECLHTLEGHSGIFWRTLAATPLQSVIAIGTALVAARGTLGPPKPRSDFAGASGLWAASLMVCAGMCCTAQLFASLFCEGWPGFTNFACCISVLVGGSAPLAAYLIWAALLGLGLMAKFFPAPTPTAVPAPAPTASGEEAWADFASAEAPREDNVAKQFSAMKLDDVPQHASSDDKMDCLKNHLAALYQMQPQLTTNEQRFAALNVNGPSQMRPMPGLQQIGAAEQMAMHSQQLAMHSQHMFFQQQWNGQQQQQMRAW